MASSETKELKAQWKADVVLPEYSMQDIAAHNTKTDTWIVIHGQGRLFSFIQLSLSDNS
jgi:cytochrome-b5 reductase